MSNREYFNLCEKDNWQEEQANDPDYEIISIDYSQKSWEQFTTDLNNPESTLRKDLNVITGE